MGVRVEEPDHDEPSEPPEFLTAGAAVAGLGAWGRRRPAGRKRPIVVASANGLRAVEKAMELIKAGADPLDAAIAGVAIVEADPNDHTVGYGGIPNEDGVVELDAAVMHGPTHGGGAVAVAPQRHAPGGRRPARHEADRPLPARRRGGLEVRPRARVRRGRPVDRRGPRNLAPLEGDARQGRRLDRAPRRRVTRGRAGTSSGSASTARSTARRWTPTATSGA